jgi:hypothetical protein
MGSPLKHGWDGHGEREPRLIVINDDIPTTTIHNSFLNIVFERIREYEYSAEKPCNPLQRVAFWKNIRCYTELKHREILASPSHGIRVRLLSEKIYGYTCLQEALFENDVGF